MEYSNSHYEGNHISEELEKGTVPLISFGERMNDIGNYPKRTRIQQHLYK
ncbi:hypothetical protein KY290_013497 [Solanum tuberosum]|uniref:Uncharacterized protein n=1 Tax=Solanum tuberosum TaxID=4113 RepID=A0ABQ7VN50_SOLTU|nr:hypothetical protein KY289_013613 [Solanum tuberosum]KAH0716927.1 hypothetical protein KY285_012958 [Solanum tuberosum]KAH0769516.1 hypothetical protein KY290_013497 [Solanum tuberosum]